MVFVEQGAGTGGDVGASLKGTCVAPTRKRAAGGTCTRHRENLRRDLSHGLDFFPTRTDDGTWVEAGAGSGKGSGRARSQGFGGYRLSIARRNGGAQRPAASVCACSSGATRRRRSARCWNVPLPPPPPPQPPTPSPPHEPPTTPTDARHRPPLPPTDDAECVECAEYDDRDDDYARTTAATTTTTATTPLCSGVKFTGRAGRPIRG